MGGTHIIRTALGIGALCVLSFTLILYMETPGLAFRPRMSAATVAVNKTLPSTKNNNATATSSSTLSLAESLSVVTNEWSRQERIVNLTEQQLRPFAKPTPKRPFVFFHMRKAGGTSWRAKILAAVGDDQKNAAWIPCLKAANCRSYIPPSGGQKQRYAVYAGHLYYADMENRLNYARLDDDAQQQPKNKNPMVHIRDKNQFDCLIQVRSTVDRVVSCWNYRFAQELNFPKLAHNLTAREWDHYLPRIYSQYMEGCNNENVRVLGSIADEAMVNTLTSSSYSNNNHSSSSYWYSPMVADPALLQRELERIYHRMSRCVVLLNGHDETNAAILRHYIPWLSSKGGKEGGGSGGAGADGAAGTATTTKEVVLNKGRFPAQNLTAGSAAVILKHNQMDEAIYQYAVKLSMEQYRIATTTSLAAALDNDDGDDDDDKNKTTAVRR